MKARKFHRIPLLWVIVITCCLWVTAGAKMETNNIIYFYLLLLILNTESYVSSLAYPSNAKRFTCLRNENQNIPADAFCDGKMDCSDGSDEFPANCNNCTLFNEHSMYSYASCNNKLNPAKKACLVRRFLICQQHVTCVGLTPCDLGCKSHFRCPGGKCLKRSTVCGASTCNDCPGVERWNNGHGFKCVRGGKKCRLPQFLLWDGVKDCDDGTDLCFASHLNLTNVSSEQHTEQPFRAISLFSAGVVDCISTKTVDGFAWPFDGDVRSHSLANFNLSLCFECLDKSLIISKGSLCDGIIDCPDMTDECLCDENVPEICSKVQPFSFDKTLKMICPVGQVLCDKNKCLDRKQVCDGVADCRDLSDEKFSYCHGTIPCANASQIGEPCRCTNLGKATCHQRIGLYCDRHADCLQTTGTTDNLFLSPPADECNSVCIEFHGHTTKPNDTHPPINCTAVSVSKKKTPFVCKKIFGGTRKVPAYKVCDGIVDCQPGSNLTDEESDSCPWRYACPRTDNKISIPTHRLCNGYNDCADGRDEHEERCVLMGRYYCSSLGGLKVSIKKHQVCDQIFNCDDNSDEINCTNDGRFYCENGNPLFVSNRKLFNGIGDCTDWSDECPTSVKIRKENTFSSRHELIANPVLRAFVWIMGLLAVAGNAAVIVVESRNLYISDLNLASLRTNHMLILNLAVADTLMGIYLILLGGTSCRYSGSYCSFDMLWRSSRMCIFMGVLVVISIETSMLTMVLLTISRLYAVYRPFEASSKPSGKFVAACVIVTWCLAFLVALLPLSTHVQKSFTGTAWIKKNQFFHKALVEFSSFQQFMERLTTFGNISHRELDGDMMKIAKASSWSEFETLLTHHHNHEQTVVIYRYFGYYSTHSVCIPKIYVTKDDNAWGFSLMITTLNFIAFIFVTSAYTLIYMKSVGKPARRTSDKKKKIKQSGVSKKGKARKQTQEIQRKIIRLMITDFCCWVPVSIMAFINFVGVDLPPDAYAVSAIILLPINSALNPIVYSNLFDNLLAHILGRFKEKRDRSSSATELETLKSNDKV